MKKERMIQPVTDTKDKEFTYRTMLSRYQTAMKDGFFLEAMLIDYAMIEDRMRSFIYHSGALANRNSNRINGPARKYIVEIIKKENPRSNLGIMTISGKINIIVCLLKWEEDLTEQPSDHYLRTLRSKIEDLDIGEFFQILDSCEQWRKYRNECIHSVMNKNMVCLEGGIKEKAAEGMEYARFIDSQVKLLKKGNDVRRSIGLK